MHCIVHSQEKDAFKGGRYTLYSVGEVIYEERIAHVNFRSNYLLFTVVARTAAIYFFFLWILECAKILLAIFTHRETH